MNTTTIFSAGWIDIVFDGRNKAYGAYQLRKIKDKTLLFALLFSLSLFSGIVAVPMLSGNQFKPPAEKSVPYYFQDTLQPPPFFETAQRTREVERSVEKTEHVIDQYKYEIVDSNTMIEQIDTSEIFEYSDAGIGGEDGGEFASAGGIGGGDGSMDSGGETDDSQINKLHDWVEEMPEYPGGFEAFRDFISRKIVYPRFAGDNGIEGKVTVGFVVEADGSITDVKVLRGAHRLLDEEAVRVVKLMPKWKPGRQNERTVRVRYSVPINFSLM